MTTEAAAREKIDTLLTAAGWRVFDAGRARIHTARGVAIREFPLTPGHGFADYLLYVDGRAAGVIEAKKQGVTLSGVETQSDKYTQGLPDGLPSWHTPLPFAYQSTGTETRFTNGLDPEPRARPVFAFHKPETLAGWLDSAKDAVALQRPEYMPTGKTFLARMPHLPPLIEEGLWPAQITAIHNLERSLRENRPRALIQMATGSGKTFTAISFIYRLIKFAGARRVLFLVDRGNLGDQTLKEFQQYVSPYNNFKFSDEYIVQRLSSNTLDTTARVCISTIQRMYAVLKGRELPDDLDELSSMDLEYAASLGNTTAGHSGRATDKARAERGATLPDSARSAGTSSGDLPRRPEPIEYNPAIPIETFDIIVTDECHRSIYNLWAQVLEYFDAYLIGLTATPNKQTFGFFHRNLVMEYPHEQAVADGVNVNYDVYRIKTRITEGGSLVEAGYYVEQQDRQTRAKRWDKLDEDLEYEAKQLDRDVVTPDQIRTVVRAFRDKLSTEIFPGRTEVPKTLFFAKDDNHAENIVEILREEFGKGNEFAQKITYRTTGATPQALIKSFRNSYFPRIAVTVDMIATGTDIKPVEIVVFMRSVKSRSFFEQMKGRGVRVIGNDDLKAVTPDAQAKDHFVIVDAVGVCEQDKTDSRPLDQKKAVSFEKLLQAVSFGNTEEAVLTSIAARLARMEHRLTEDDDQKIRDASGGYGVKDLSRQLVEAVNPDRLYEEAINVARMQRNEIRGEIIPTEQELKTARANIISEAVKPLHDPKLRELLVEVKKKNEITIDHVSQDDVIEAGFNADAAERARAVVHSFEQFIADHKDEITALQILYSKPYKARLTFDDVKELADQIQAPPNLWTESQLWQAYAALEKTKVKGAGGRRILTDLVSLVRFAIHQDNELVPFPERVQANFNAWLASQAQSGRQFSEEQVRWLKMIRDHIAANLGIETDDFEYAPFSQQGGLGKVHQLFGLQLPQMLSSLNQSLVA